MKHFFTPAISTSSSVLTAYSSACHRKHADDSVKTAV